MPFTVFTMMCLLMNPKKQFWQTVVSWNSKPEKVKANTFMSAIIRLAKAKKDGA